MARRVSCGSLANAVAGGGVTIVLVGSHHVPELYDKLSPQVNTGALAMLDPAQAGDTDHVKRSSYLLSKPEILKINPGPELLYDGPPLNAVNFINHVLS